MDIMHSHPQRAALAMRKPSRFPMFVAMMKYELPHRIMNMIAGNRMPRTVGFHRSPATIGARASVTSVPQLFASVVLVWVVASASVAVGGIVVAVGETG